LTRSLVLSALVTTLLVGESASAPARPERSTIAGSWVGTYRLAGPDRLAFRVSGRHVQVELGAGHAGLQSVPLARRGATLSFRIPGRPAPVVFTGSLEKDAIRGNVRQGSVAGSFIARRGSAPQLLARGLFRSSTHTLAVVDDPYGPERLVDLETGEVHGLYLHGREFTVGAGFATLSPAAGTASFGETAAVVLGRPAKRLPVRQLEVRFRSDGALLAGTLSIPVGSGPHAAVAFIQGSGATERAYLPDLHALLLDHGVAVLAYDKRGVGQSSGRYPGESPTAATIDTLARDATAAARFLATQPAIDPARVGLAGHSQAGWIVPLAASREHAVRFALLFSGPTVTTDEVDLFQTLAGQGEHAPTLTDDEINERVEQAGPSGVDPLPWIRALEIPSLWVYGKLDRHIPAQLSVRRLRPLRLEPGRDIAIETFPRANHALVDTKTGLTAEMLASSHFAAGMFEAVGTWLRTHGLTDG
jgi:uncharacterized protein